VDGKQAGPFDLAALSQKAKEGALTRATLVWRQGMASWVAAESVPELRPVLDVAPPPLPPA
jgi:hypothetical protein